MIKNLIILFLFFTNNTLSANNDSFEECLNNFKTFALEHNISY